MKKTIKLSQQILTSSFRFSFVALINNHFHFINLKLILDNTDQRSYCQKKKDESSSVERIGYWTYFILY